MKKGIIIISILVVVGVLVFVTLNKNEDGDSTLISFVKDLEQFEYYPDTTEAPVLELIWDGELDPTEAIRYTPYGVWEGWFEYPEGTAYEQANEMQFYMDTEATDYLAIAPGIVTQSETFGGGSGLLSVQYGHNYVITYMHIFPSDDIKIGQKIEKGDYIGQMEKRTTPDGLEETWWEIMLTTYSDGKYRTLPPYDYFSDEGKAKMDELALNFEYGGITDEAGKITWTVDEGCSWLKYAPDGWWDSGRFFDHDPEQESHQEFLDSLGLGWQVGDLDGRIIGPTDECN